ncbi:hypothetical protein K6025_03000 [Ehrlichia sp. JZT12]
MVATISKLPIATLITATVCIISAIIVLTDSATYAAFLYFVNESLSALELVQFNSWSASRNSVLRADKTISTLINNRSLALSCDCILNNCMKIEKRKTLKYIILAENARQYLILCFSL